MRKGEKKIIVSFRSYPVRKGKCKKKKAKKLKKKLKNTIMASFQAKLFGKGHEREKIKIIVSSRSYQTRYRKFEKNSEKIKKIPLWLNFNSKLVERG